MKNEIFNQKVKETKELIREAKALMPFVGIQCLTKLEINLVTKLARL